MAGLPTIPSTLRTSWAFYTIRTRQPVCHSKGEL